MKKYLKIILIGAASWKKNDQLHGGQIPLIKNIINEDIEFFSCDPEHRQEPDKYLSKCAGVPVSRGSSPSAINLKSLNVHNLYAEEFFNDLIASEDTYYLTLVYTGIERENPSFSIAKKLGIKNRFFWDTKNALFLSFGCLTKPQDIEELLTKLHLKNELDVDYINNKLKNLFFLQRAYYAFQNNIDALSRSYKTNIIPEWGHKSLRRLRHINIYSLEDANTEYENLSNYKNIGLEKLIKEELEILGLIQFWDERPNDFFSQ